MKFKKIYVAAACGVLAAGAAGFGLGFAGKTVMAKGEHAEASRQNRIDKNASARIGDAGESRIHGVWQALDDETKENVCAILELSESEIASMNGRAVRVALKNLDKEQMDEIHELFNELRDSDSEKKDCKERPADSDENSTAATDEENAAHAKMRRNICKNGENRKGTDPRTGTDIDASHEENLRELDNDDVSRTSGRASGAKPGRGDEIKEEDVSSSATQA